MARRRTLLWSLLLLTSALVMGLSVLRLGKYREDAAVARRNWVAAQRAMDEIHRWRTSPGRAAAGVNMETPQLTSKLREAATAAGLADAPGSEANAPTRIANSDYNEMLVFLRFEPINLKQLTTFLHALARIDPSSRAKSIELSPPQPSADRPQPPARAGEQLWTADVAVGYLTYSPQKSGK